MPTFNEFFTRTAKNLVRPTGPNSRTNIITQGQQTELHKQQQMNVDKQSPQAQTETPNTTDGNCKYVEVCNQGTGFTAKIIQDPSSGGAKNKKKSSKSKTSKKQGGGSGPSASLMGPKPTNQRVMVGGRNAVVYKGPRGGSYVKKGGEYVPLSKAK